jgi:hypothetical protein
MPKWPGIKKHVSSLCTVYEYEVDKLPQNLASSKVKSMIGWFPCVILFDSNDFSRVGRDPSFVPKHAIFNGRFNVEKSKSEYVASGKQINENDLASWIKEVTSSKEFRAGVQASTPTAETQAPKSPPPPPRTNAPVLDETCNNTWKLRGSPWY